MTEINGNPKGLNRVNQEGAEQPSNKIVEVFPEQALPRVVERYHEEDAIDPSAVVFSQLRLEVYSIVLHKLLCL